MADQLKCFRHLKVICDACDHNGYESKGVGALDRLMWLKCDHGVTLSKECDECKFVAEIKNSASPNKPGILSTATQEKPFYIETSLDGKHFIVNGPDGRSKDYDFKGAKKVAHRKNQVFYLGWKAALAFMADKEKGANNALLS